jgi:hypothetical protein
MPYQTAEKTTQISVSGAAPPPAPPPTAPPGKVTVTVVAKLFGLIPASGVKVTADTVEAVTDESGTAYLTLDEGAPYTVRLTAWWMQTEEFKIEKAAEAKLEIAVMPSILLWLAGSAGVGGIAYIFTGKALPSALVAGATFAVWPILRYAPRK